MFIKSNLNYSMQKLEGDLQKTGKATKVTSKSNNLANICQWANLHPLTAIKVTTEICKYSGIEVAMKGEPKYKNVEFQDDGSVKISPNSDGKFGIAIPKDKGDSSKQAFIISNSLIDQCIMTEEKIEKFDIYVITKSNLINFGSLLKQKNAINKALGIYSLYAFTQKKSIIDQFWRR